MAAMNAVSRSSHAAKESAAAIHSRAIHFLENVRTAPHLLLIVLLCSLGSSLM
jgi:hypothetical protein